MRRLAIALAVAAGVPAAAVAAQAAVKGGDDPATGVHLTPLSTASFGSSVRASGAGTLFRTHGAKEMLTTAITVDPGGSFGWHSHPGPVLVALSRGTLTEYHADGRRCPRTTVTAGQAFVEDGGMVHLARNETSAPVELNAIFFAKPGTTEFLIPEARPGVCHV